MLLEEVKQIARVLILLIPIILVISACSDQSREPIQITRSTIQRPVLSLPPTTIYQTRPVEWVIITPDNFQEKLEILNKNNEEYVFFALTTSGYENLSKNMADILRFVREQNAVIIAYRNYYENAERIIATHNSSN